ncbi:MAG: hypothetical protein IPG96_17010 [Proteobacteria bacterium]|nr:hypothetical protein [Pseudomonadota bacterium]
MSLRATVACCGRGGSPSWSAPIGLLLLLLAGVAGPSPVRATTAATPLPSAVRPVAGRGVRVGTGAGLALQLHADRLVLRPEAGCTLGQACASEIELAGAVSVRSAGLQLRAGRVAVSLDARGRPYRVRAVEGVVMQFGARSGRADELVLLAHPRRVTLRGNARLEHAEQGLALRGSWIEVDLENGAVIVQRAEVALP